MTSRDPVSLVDLRAGLEADTMVGHRLVEESDQQDLQCGVLHGRLPVAGVAAPLRRRCHLQVLSAREHARVRRKEYYPGGHRTALPKRRSAIQARHDFADHSSSRLRSGSGADRVRMARGNSISHRRRPDVHGASARSSSCCRTRWACRCSSSLSTIPRMRAAPNRRCWALSIGRALPICRAAATLRRA